MVNLGSVHDYTCENKCSAIGNETFFHQQLVISLKKKCFCRLGCRIVERFFVAVRNKLCIWLQFTSALCNFTSLEFVYLFWFFFKLNSIQKKHNFYAAL